MEASQPLDLALIAGLQREEPLMLSWPTDGVPAGWLSIQTPGEWQAFVASLGLPNGVPEIVSAKYRRAQMLYFLAWLYPDLMKAGELVGLTTLELALRDFYGTRVKGRGNRKPDFAALLQYMPKDSLTDDKIPMVRRSGGTAIGFGRERIGHRWQSDGICWRMATHSKLVRDLIGFPYREHIAVAATIPVLSRGCSERE